MTDAVNNHVDKVIVRSNFDYLTLPILFRVHGGKKLRYFFNAGPFVGLLLQQTFVVKSELNPTTVEDNTANDLPFDFGISSGFGLSLPIQPTFALSLELRNNLGLANVSAAPIRNGGSIKTNSTNLLIGFSFGIGQAKE